MANKLYDENAIKNIADAIRDINGFSSTYKVSEMSVLSNYNIKEYIETGTITSLPNVTKLCNYALAYQNISQAIFQDCSIIGDSAFYRCSSLTTASFPECITIGSSAFAYCSSLTEVEFPKCTTIQRGVFNSCSNLETVSLPNGSIIGISAFQFCTHLNSVYLLGSNVVTLSNSTAFKSTPIASGTGKVYVPSSLYESYLTASYWSDIYSTCLISM